MQEYRLEKEKERCQLKTLLKRLKLTGSAKRDIVNDTKWALSHRKT